MFPGLQEPLDMGQEDVTWREKACTQPQQLPAFLFTVPTWGETQNIKKSLMAWMLQICFAQCRLVHLSQGQWMTFTWCGCPWAAWGSGSRFHPSGVQLSRHLQIFGLSAHWLSGSFWMGSHPCTSALVGGKSQGPANQDVWGSPSVDNVIKDILHMITEVASTWWRGHSVR